MPSSVVSGFPGGIATNNTPGTAPAIEPQHKPAQIVGFGHGTSQAIAPTSKAGAAPQGSPWANPSAAVKSTASNVTRNAYLQHSTVASRVPAHIRPGKSTMGGANTSVANLEAQLAHTGVSNSFGGGLAPYNPSQGPTASQITTPWRPARSTRTNASFSSARLAVNNAVCKLTGYTRKDFQKGEVISLPHHAANTDPNIDPNTDNRWRSTVEGPVYSKRRMMVVLFIYGRDMLCLPLYTWNKSGISRRPAWLKNEYVGVQDANNLNYINHGDYPPVIIEGNRRPMHEHSTVVLSAGCKVSCNEDILSVGRLTQKSHTHLVALWQELNRAAVAEAWRR
ncbi:hypothetical protein D0862_09564 [Hortaea werneckii]|uniref:DUF6590 domain-containing protein n=1 Tax=Hortaea werneckii TaxID=91943 RepID=A0A3M7FUP4_HORWE|nr:hypothetical protein D0862_09564 [Hortaea werneckii]